MGDYVYCVCVCVCVRTYVCMCVCVFQADWDAVGLVAMELYDHIDDDGLGEEAFDEHEFSNLAYLSDR